MSNQHRTIARRPLSLLRFGDGREFAVDSGELIKLTEGPSVHAASLTAGDVLSEEQMANIVTQQLARGRQWWDQREDSDVQWTLRMPKVLDGRLRELQSEWYPSHVGVPEWAAAGNTLRKVIAIGLTTISEDARRSEK